MANPASLTRLLQDHAPRVHCPTLILERHLKYAADRVARLAASFPNSRLLLFEGEQTLPYLGNVGEVVDAIRTFVSPASEAGSARRLWRHTRTRTRRAKRVQPASANAKWKSFASCPRD